MSTATLTRHSILTHGAIGVREAAGAALTLVVSAMARLRQRQQLLALTEDQLKDIGVTRGQAVREASKPFWRA